MKNKIWREHLLTLAEFSGHLVAGTALFCMIGIAGLFLEVFTSWLAAMGMSASAVKVLGMVEHLLLVLDLFLMVTWVAASSFKAMKSLLELNKG
ncbi:hypothetical protein [Ottowia sp.]|uniref:hypothetical protein n=1 Tax=Ottowia sp. TaxID=1898956 RepID=UPI0025D2E70D|nr:hypothetical protein [Ottowia sp.]MBK6616166.1 hypothetical protein [Ottowia sp.]